MIGSVMLALGMRIYPLIASGKD